MKAAWYVGWILVTVGAFVLGQQYERAGRLADIDDSINRIALTQYTLLDLGVRTNHFVNPKHHDNPWCPECWDQLKRIESHKIPVT